MKNKKALSLVELIVWVTISMLIMVSIWVFLSSWLKNIFIQEKSIWNILEINDFYDYLQKTVWNFDKNLEIFEWESTIFQRKTEYDEWWFSFIWQIEKDDFCKNWIKTNHIFVKNFIPNSWDYKETSWNFSTNQKENSVFEVNKKIIWNGFFGKNFKNWEFWENVALNWPTWITGKWNFLYISDTLNNRILKYHKPSKKVYNFLSEEDWLDLPTWLYFDNENLLIANSWKWEILEYKNYEKYENELNFSLNEDKFIDFNKIDIEFKKEFDLWIEKENFDFNLKNIWDLDLKWNIFEKDSSKLKNISYEDKNWEIKFDTLKDLKDLEKIIHISKKITFSKKSNTFEDFYDFKVWEKKEGIDIKENYDDNKEILKNFKTEIKIDKKKEIYNGIPEKIYKKLNLEDSKIENIFKKKIWDFEDFKVLWFYEEIKIDNFVWEKLENNIFEEVDFDKDKTKYLVKIEYKKENNNLKEEIYELKKFKTNFEFKIKDVFDIFWEWKWLFTWKIILSKGIDENFKSEEINIFQNNLIKLNKRKENLNFPYKINWKDDFTEFDKKSVKFNKKFDKILDIPIKSLDISKDWDFLNIIIKYYRNFDCEDLDLNEQKINTLFLKKKIN